MPIYLPLFRTQTTGSRARDNWWRQAKRSGQQLPHSSWFERCQKRSRFSGVLPQHRLFHDALADGMRAQSQLAWQLKSTKRQSVHCADTGPFPCPADRFAGASVILSGRRSAAPRSALTTNNSPPRQHATKRRLAHPPLIPSRMSHFDSEALEEIHYYHWVWRRLTAMTMLLAFSIGTARTIVACWISITR